MATAQRRRAPSAEALEPMAGSVYGVRLAGQLPRRFRPYLRALPGGGGEPAPVLDLRYRSLAELPRVDPFWCSEAEAPEVRERLALFRDGDGLGLRIDGPSSGVLRLGSSSIGIDWVAGVEAAPHFLFSYALPLWLEGRGVTVLHASAVSFGEVAVAFLGPSGVGKSTLCAELLRLGCGFVADDGLAAREEPQGTWRTSYGPPMLRLWPSALEERLGLSAARLPKVHGDLEKRQLRLRAAEPRGEAGGRGPRLGALYLLRRAGDPEGSVRVERCTAREALVHLIEHSLAASPAAALGLSAARLERLARLAARVPLVRLAVPSAGDSTARAHQAILSRL